MLNTPKGIEKLKKRCFDVEPTFGNIKHYHGFKRFLLRGKDKVEIRVGAGRNCPKPKEKGSLKSPSSLNFHIPIDREKRLLFKI